MIKGLVSLLLYPLIITVVLMLSLGIIQYEKQSYNCFNGRSFNFDEKVEIAELWGLKVNAIPLRHDCPEDERYDPKLMYECGVGRWCHGTDPYES